MLKNNIQFKELKIFGKGQQLIFKGRKTWLTNKSIIINERASYYTDTAKEGKSYAISNALELIKGIETFLNAKLPYYKFKVTRQHYSLIKNSLAIQYNKEGKKLNIYNKEGLWFLIDNSYNLNEAETVHPKTADIDNEKVQAHFNIIKQTPLELINNITPSFLMETLNKQIAINDRLISERAYYSQAIQEHIQAVQDLGQAVGNLVKVIQELKESSIGNK